MRRPYVTPWPEITLDLGDEAGPELASAGCMPAKASDWSNSPKRQMSPISARKLPVQAGPTPSIVCS